MRCLRIAIAVFAVMGLTMAAEPVDAGSVASDRNQFLNLLNDLRASQGAAPLQLDPELTAIAQEWAEHVAVVKQMVHPADPTAGISSPYSKVGENVAYGSNTQITWQGLVDSPSHYTNMVDPDYTHIGIGIAYADGVQYISQRFMALAPAPPPTAEPEPEPAPPPPSEPLAAPVEPPIEVLGAVLVREPVNLAVIQPIRYGTAVATTEPAQPDDSPPVLAILAAVLVALLTAGGVTRAIRTRKA